MKNRYITIFVVACAVAYAPARAEDVTPDLVDAALQAAIAQRDQALNEGVRLSARLAMAQKEIARLRRELNEARGTTAPAPAEPTK